MIDIAEKELRDWLLHRLDAEGTARVDEALFTEAALADRIDEARADLLDDCARGRLTEAERRLVLQHLVVTSAERWRYRIARAWAQLGEAVPAPLPIWHRIGVSRVALAGGLLAACLLLALGMPSIWPGAGVPKGDTNSARGDTSGTSGLPVVALVANHRRGSDAGAIALPRYESRVVLQAEVDDGRTADERYAITIADEHAVVFTARDLLPRQSGPFRFVEIELPAGTLSSGLRRISLAATRSPNQAIDSWDVDVAPSR